MEEEKVITQNQEISKNDTDIETQANTTVENQEYTGETEAHLYLRTKHNKSMDITTFLKQDRHYFIMTDGGKPIYSRYGDELKHSEILATFSAIMTKFTVFNSDESFAEKINYISNEKATIVFLKKGNIIFIALSKLHDSISFLYSQLEFLYSQLLSIITSERMITLEENPNSCIGTLQDTQELFEEMLLLTTNTMASHISAYQVLPLENRKKYNDICNSHRGDALICCLLSPIEIIALSKTNLITLTYTDVILMQNMILHSESLQSSESWVPLCLPGISPEGYLQMYSNFTGEIGIVYITESQDNEYFIKFAEKSRTIMNDLIDKNLLPKIEQSLKTKNNTHSETYDSSNFDMFIKKLFQHSPIEQDDTEIIKDNEINDNGKDNNSSIQIQEIDSINAMPIPETPLINETNNVNEIIEETQAQTLSQKTTAFPENVYSIKASQSDPMTKLKYALCKHKVYNQYFTVNFGPFDKIKEEELSIYRTYGLLFDLYNSQDASLINMNNFFHFEKDDKYAHAIFASDNVILIATYNLFMAYDEMHTHGRDLLKIIKSYEKNFFIHIK